MGDVVDSFGQWLTQLPVLGQTAVLLGILLPVGGLVAFGFIGLIDVVVGRVLRRWAQRTVREPRDRINVADTAPDDRSGSGARAEPDGRTGRTPEN